MIQPIAFLVRHGSTPDNKKNEYRGWATGPEAQLNAQGRDDVRKAALYLKTTGYKYPFVISDSLPRASESRDIIADILGIKVRQTDDRARTIDVGDFTGKSKAEYPLDKYAEAPSKPIPGGESFNRFHNRMASFWADIADLSEQLKKPPIVISHGAVSAFLYNHINGKDKSEAAGYEGLTYPGGVLVLTKDGITPLTNKRTNGGVYLPYKDGTPLSGFVTEKESHLPRACWNCRWAQRDVNNLLGCSNLIVRLDPDLISRRQADGTVAVDDNDCSDYFQSRISS